VVLKYIPSQDKIVAFDNMCLHRILAKTCFIWLPEFHFIVFFVPNIRKPIIVIIVTIIITSPVLFLFSFPSLPSYLIILYCGNI